MMANQFADELPLRGPTETGPPGTGTSAADAIDLTNEESDNFENSYISPYADGFPRSGTSTQDVTRRTRSLSPPQCLREPRPLSRKQRNAQLGTQRPATKNRPLKRAKAKRKANNYTSMIHQVTRSRHARLRQRSPEQPEVKILDSHRRLSFWKKKSFNKHQLQETLMLARRAASRFDKSTITTVVPNRYLSPPLLSSTMFPGTLSIQPSLKAVEHVYKEHTAENLDVNRLVLWTDGSVSGKGKQGLAFAWRYSETDGWGPWQALGYKVTGADVNSDVMEFLAVIKALDWACEVVPQSLKSLKAVAVYTDAQSVIHKLRRGSHESPPALHIVKRATRLVELGVTDISIHWVPGHSRVPGNVLADKVAGYAGAHSYELDEEHIDLSDDEDEVDSKPRARPRPAQMKDAKHEFKGKGKCPFGE